MCLRGLEITESHVNSQIHEGTQNDNSMNNEVSSLFLHSSAYSVLYLRDYSPEFSVLAAVLEPALDGAIHTVPLSGAEGSPQSTDRKMIQTTY